MSTLGYTILQLKLIHNWNISKAHGFSPHDRINIRQQLYTNQGLHNHNGYRLYLKQMFKSPEHYKRQARHQWKTVHKGKPFPPYLK